MKDKIDLPKVRKSIDRALGNQLFLNRLIGKAIDLIIAIALASILYPAGPLAAFLYILICDGLHNGQSVGKRVVGIYVINTMTDQKSTFRDSIVRNSPIALIVLFPVDSALGLDFVVYYWTTCVGYGNIFDEKRGKSDALGRYYG